MKIKLFFIIFFCMHIAGFEKVIAQAPSCIWAKSIGSTVNDVASSMVLDASGNTYTTGFFQGTVDFDPDLFSTFNLTSNGLSDIFILKLDQSGNFLWAKSTGGFGDDAGASITMDANGNVYTTGYFSGIVDFNPASSQSLILTSSGSNDIYISKFDGAGNFIWAKNMGGSDGDYGQSITVDSSENVYTIGNFNGTADFNPDKTAIANLTSAGFSDIFISKLDSIGNFVWVNKLGGKGNDNGASIILDAKGNLYATGCFQDTVDFNPNLAITNALISTGRTDAFISKFNKRGTFIWAKAMGGTEDDAISSIAIDTFGNIYATGYFSKKVDFDPDLTDTCYLTSNGVDDIFISKLDSTGNFKWAKSMGGLNRDYGNFIAVDDTGNVYTTGFFLGFADFNPDTTLYYGLTSHGDIDAFISKIDSSGNFVWAKAIGGLTTDIGYSITINNSGEITVAGIFASSSIIVDAHFISNIVNTGNYYDIFIIRLDNIVTGLQNFDPSNSISIYPNPAVNYINLDLKSISKNINVNIFDIRGKIIYSTISTPSQNLIINTTDFAEGMYVVNIQTEDFIETKKFIVLK